MRGKEKCVGVQEKERKNETEDKGVEKDVSNTGEEHRRWRQEKG